MASLNAFTSLGKFLTPLPAYTDYEYDGLEYRWKIFVFRPALFKTEAYILAAVLFYLLAWLFGKHANAKRANSWYNAHRNILEAQFSRPSNGGLTQDGYSDFFNFSTGRRAVASLHTVFTLSPRHDLLQTLFHFGYGLVDLNYRHTDDITLDFKLHSSTGAPGCIWAVVNKNELKSIRNDRWDLTFTKTTENPNLHPTLSVMSEFADITEHILKSHGNFDLGKVLSDPSILPYFRSLSLTDQPSERPTAGPLNPEEREKHVILVLSCPSPSHATETIPLISSIFSFIDILDTKIAPALRPETKSKLKKIRDELDKQLKIDSAKEQKEEAADEKRAAKRREEEARIARLSAAEQKKIMDRDRKRSMRKTQGKVARK